MEIIWKDVTLPEHAGLYEASSDGRLKDKETGEIIDIKLDNTGRPMLQAFKQNGSSSKKFDRSYRLIVSAFKGFPENYKEMEVDHIDGHPYNNKPENLRWLTHEQNMNTEVARKRKSESAYKALKDPVKKHNIDEGHKRSWQGENRKNQLKGLEKVHQKLCRAVLQIDQKGQVVRILESMTEAARIAGAYLGYMSRNLKKSPDGFVCGKYRYKLANQNIDQKN